MPLGVGRVWPWSCASLLLPILGLRATTRAAAAARAEMRWGCEGDGAGVSCKRVAGDGVGVAAAVAAGGGLVAVWCSSRSTTSAKPNRGPARNVGRGSICNGRWARRWSSATTICNGSKRRWWWWWWAGGMQEAVMRLRQTETLDRVVCTCDVLAQRLRPQKAGNRC
jgi:hypothetical protein